MQPCTRPVQEPSQGDDRQVKQREELVLPNFMIVGAQRGGTTSLAHYMREHPEIFIPRGEVHFFDHDETWRRGSEYYSTLFSGASGQQRIGDYTPAYSYQLGLQPPIPQRIAEMIPHLQLIWCLRNPVSRAHSHYWFDLMRGRESRSFEDAVQSELRSSGGPGHGYLRHGLYVNQIRAFLQVFPIHDMQFVLSERLFSDPQGTLRAVFRFLAVNPAFEGRRVGRVMNAALPVIRPGMVQRLIWRALRSRRHWRAKLLKLLGKPRPEMHPQTRHSLQEFYRPHNEELATLVGLDLSLWQER